MQLTLPVNYNYGDAKLGWTEEELRTELNIRTKQELK